MQLTKEDFKLNLIKTIEEITGNIELKDSRFLVIPVVENNVKYNSTDDYIRLGMLSERNIKDRFFDLEQVVNFLVFPNEKFPRLFPLWVEVKCLDSTFPNFLFELRISMRFRTCSQLKNIETGHPPFIQL